MNVTVDRILAELGLATVHNKILQEENAKLQAQIAALTPKDKADESTVHGSGSSDDSR